MEKSESPQKTIKEAYRRLFLVKKAFTPAEATIVIVIIVLIAIFLLLPRFLKSPAPTVTQPPQTIISEEIQNPKKIVASDTVLATVGTEKIYQSDLNAEKAAFPPQMANSSAKTLLDKIINDSIILQGAAADKLITLDNTVFNSPKKDYLKRTKLVAEAKTQLISKEDGISGAVISIWFFNTKPANVGLQKGQQIALVKITQLHDDVASKKITIEQAGEAIKNDTSLAQVDTAYKNNAIFKFQVKSGEIITFSPNFDQIIRQLKEGGVSQVFLANDKDPKTGKIIPAVYLFAQAQKIIQNGEVGTFDQWLTNKKKQYEIIYY